MVAIKSLLVAFTALTATASAAVIPKRLEHQVVDRDIDLSHLISSFVCPKGQSLWSVTNTATIPKHTAADVWKYLGDFCSVTWQGFTLESTTGSCNSPLSTRTFSTLGLTLTERLLLNFGNAKSPIQSQPFFYQVFELLGNPQLYGTSVTNVKDLLQVTSSSAGAQIYWNVQGCANVTATAEAVFNQVHGGAVAGAVAYFAAK